MAIEKLKLVNMFGPIARFDDTVKAVCGFGCFHPENAVQLLQGTKGFFPFSDQNPYRQPLNTAVNLLSSTGIEPGYKDFSELNLPLEEMERELLETQEAITRRKDDLDALSRRYSDCEQIIKQLVPLLNIDISLDELFSFEYIKFRFGRITRDNYERLLLYAQDNPHFLFIPSTIEKEYVWGMYFVPRPYEDETDSAFTSLHFKRIRISDQAHGIPREAHEQMYGELESIRSQMDKANGFLKEYVKNGRDRLLSIYSKLRFLHDTFEMRRFAAHTSNNFYLVGWCPEGEIKRFKDELDSMEEVTCVFEDPDDGSALPVPPTRLKNNRLMRPFQDFVSMYGLPGYNEYDPTPLVAISYTILFGLMFGDIGQGLVLALGGYLVWKLKGIMLARVVATVGCSSMVFGLFYGSVFGREVLPGFSASHNVNLTLLASIGIGIALISVAIVLNMLTGIRQKDYVKVLFGHNGLAGFVFYWAVVIAVILTLGFGKNVLTIPYILVFVVLPLIVIFLKEPLSKLMARKKDWMPKNKGEYILENFFELFEVLISFTTNTISFLRVGAYAMSHAGMMMVVFELADMAGSAGSIPVAILGNIFVIGMEGLIVGIQVLRLEFYEIFGRFFEGTGKPFTPVRIEYKKQ